jgi:hypothetical protein
MVHYRKLKEKQSLRRRKGFQGQFTPSSKDRSAEDNTGKYKPVICFTVETEATGAIGVQILSLKGHDNLKTFVMDKLIFLLVVFI